MMKCVGRQAIKPQNPSFEGSDASFAGSLVCRLSLTDKMTLKFSSLETEIASLKQLWYDDHTLLKVLASFGRYCVCSFLRDSAGWKYTS